MGPVGGTKQTYAKTCLKQLLSLAKSHESRRTSKLCIISDWKSTLQAELKVKNLLNREWVLNLTGIQFCQD